MSSTTLYRLSGICLLIGSLVVIAGIVPTIIVSSPQTSTLSATTALIRLLGAMLVALGLPGVYARESGRGGILGLIGFIGTFFFILMAMATEPIFAFVFPFLAVKAPAVVNGPPPASLFLFFLIDGLMLLIGGSLLGVAILRTTSSVRWAGLVLIAGALVNFVGNFLPHAIVDGGIVIFLVGLIWLAGGMWSKQPAPGEEALLPPTGVRA